MGHETDPNAALARWRLYKEIFESDAGRTLLEDLKRVSHYGATPFIPGKPDCTAFRCGQQDIVQGILNILATSADRIAELAGRDIQNEAARLGALGRPAGADDFLFPQKGRSDGER